MADGYLNFDTKINESGFNKGIKGLGKAAKAGLSAITAAGAGLLTMSGYAVKVGSDFEAGMSKVSAISGASGEALDALSEKAKEMGAKTKFSASEAASAMEYMAMAGWKTEDMLSGIEGIMNLAAASGEDLATTSDIVTDALTAFGLTAADSGHFADVLAAASSNANTNVGMMGETFKYVAPVAGALGFKAEDCATAIGLMANSGIKASQAGTALRSIFSRMAKPTDEVEAAMKKLGVSLTDSKGRMKSLDTVMRDLRKGFSGLSQAQKTQMASSLAGQEAMSGLLAIVNTSDEDFEKLQKAIYECDGASAKMAETMQDNLQGQVTILKSALEGLGIAVYENVQEPLKDLAIEGQKAVNQLTEALESGGFEGLTAEIGTVLAKAAHMLVSMAPQAAEAAVSVVQSFLYGIYGQSQELANAAASLGTELISGISEIIPLALVTGMQVITNLAEGITQQAPQITKNVGELATKMLNAFANVGPDMMSAGTEMLAALAQGIEQQLPAIGQAANGCIESLLTGIVENAPILMESGIGLLQSLADGITSALPTLIPLALETILSLADSFISNIGSVVDIGIQILTALVQGVIESLPMLIEEVPRIINEFWAAFDENAVTLLQAGLSLMGQLALGIIQNIPLILANAGEIVSAIFTTISHLDLLSAGKGLIKNLGTGIKAMLNHAGEASKSIATKIFDTIKNTNWLELGKNVINFLKTGILNMVTSVGAAGGNVAAAAFNAIKSVDWLGLGQNVIKFLINGVKGMVGNVGSALSSLAKSGMDAFKKCDWTGVGTNVIKGIISGITSKAKDLVNSAVKAAKDAVSAVKGWLGIKSPSRRARKEIGQMYGEGYILGIKDMIPEVKKIGIKLADASISVPDISKVDFGKLERKITVGNQKLFGNNVDTVNSWKPDKPVGGNGDTYVTQNININQPVKSPVETARALRTAGKELAYV